MRGDEGRPVSIRACRRAERCRRVEQRLPGESDERVGPAVDDHGRSPGSRCRSQKARGPLLGPDHEIDLDVRPRLARAGRSWSQATSTPTVTTPSAVLSRTLSSRTRSESAPSLQTTASSGGSVGRRPTAPAAASFTAARTRPVACSAVTGSGSTGVPGFTGPGGSKPGQFLRRNSKCLRHSAWRSSSGGGTIWPSSPSGPRGDPRQANGGLRGSQATLPSWAVDSPRRSLWSAIPRLAPFSRVRRIRTRAQA